MTLTIKIGKDIHTMDINAYYPLIGFNAYNDADWARVIAHSTFMVQVLDNGKTIGFGRCVDDSIFCMIYDITVHPDYQRRGIGRTIMDEIKKYVAQNDFVSVSLFYWPENKGSKPFYESCGFYELPNAMRLKK